MSDPSGPGDPSRPAGPRLERVPGDRYRAGGAAPGPGVPQSPSEPGRARSIAILASVVVAAVGAVLFALVSQVDLGFGLVAIAMFIGWAVALALVWNGAEIPRRAVLGALLGGGAIAVGLLVAWAWGRVEGGALGPLEYVNERYGPLAYLEVLAAAGVAWYRSR